ncbi:DUF4401 domain-containing protein [Sphingobacterium sp. PCS056]|uniref:DUF4401 domain-containing protein n=1 Tax=Sphingobacterium sp. PCS056 TaxID=2931400 RepID=UPI00200DD174|nr:DUF4401 domain-containing protein [Sphingobacterium sp. PCS056]UPZ38465.1 DUF4401 domain-containing protein [Sphingobacterium sp. PCS056]
MENKQAIRDKIERLSKDSDPAFQINTDNVLAEYAHLDKNSSNITIKILSILGVISSVLCFLAALFSLHLLDDKLNVMICGSILLILSLWCVKKYNSIIIDTASITCYVVGGWMLIYGLDHDDINNMLIACLMINLCTLAIVQRYLMSLLNILLIIYSCIALTSHNSDNLIFIALINMVLIAALIYILTQEAPILSKRNLISKLYQPIRVALALSTIATTAFIVLSHFETEASPFNTSAIALYALSIIYSFATLFIVHKIIAKFDTVKSNTQILIYIFVTFILASTIINPGISGAIVLILFCFYYQYKFGLYSGIIALLFFLSHFYYNLNFSLLTKSIFLMLSGLVFLVIYYIINSKKVKNENI